MKILSFLILFLSLVANAAVVAPGSKTGKYGGSTGSDSFGLEDGSVGSPSLFFSSDNDGSGTGLYRFGTNAIGVATNGVNRMTWESAGSTAIGGSVDASVMLTIRGGSGLTSTSPATLYLNTTFPSSATGAANGIYAASNTTATSYTTAVLTQFFAANISRGAGSSITRNVQYGGEMPNQGGTGNAFLADNVAFSGANFISQAGTDVSNFAGHIKYGNYHITPIEQDAGNSGTADTIDLSLGTVIKSTLTGNCTYTITNPVVGGTYVFRVLSGAGGFTLAWPATVKWAAATAPIITATAARMDLVTLLWDGTNYYGTFSQNYTP